MSEFRINTVDDCGYCGAGLTLESRSSHVCRERMQADKMAVIETLLALANEDKKALTAEAATLRKRVEGYEKLLSEVRQLEIDTREDAYTLVQGRSDGKWRVFVNYEAELNDTRYPTVLDAYEAVAQQALAESSAIGDGNE